MVTLTPHGYSKLVAYERCPRFYFYRYIEGLEPKHFSAAPAFGTLFHAARQAYFENDRNLEAAYNAIRESAAQFVGQDGFAEASEEIILYAADAIEAYAKHYKDDKLERVAFEVAFETTIGDQQFPLTGRLDGVIIVDKDVWVDECKTTGLPLSRFLPTMSMDGKTTCYVWAARKLTGKLVQGAFLDVVYKKPKMSGFEFARDVTPRSDYLLAEWERATIDTLAEIQRRKEAGYWPCHYSSCSNMYGMCCYTDLCRFGDTPELRAAQFRQREDGDREGEDAA